MFVNADDYSVVKNKWRNQQIHKIHNEIQYASKHYYNVNYDNDIIFTPKFPINQRKYRKKAENMIKRQSINKVLAFDYYDFMFQNKNENYKRIHIRPTIFYDQTRDYIDEVIRHFYDQKFSDPFTIDYTRKKSRNNVSLGTKRKNGNLKSLTESKKESKKWDPEICYQCDTNYSDSNTKHCSYCENSMWLQSLFEGNKVDIFDNRYKNWYIGTIIKLIKKIDDFQNIELHFLIHYDGFKSSNDEWIKFNFGGKYAIIKLNKIQKLHTITSYHNYELNTRNGKSVACISRKYKKCVLCDTKYCVECMIEQIKYKECNECLRLIKNNKWLMQIEKGDKLDVYLYGYKGEKYNRKWHCGWQIGTVVGIKKDLDLKHKLKLFVHFDGLEDKYDEYIDINGWSKVIRNKIKKLNKITLFHNYLLDYNKNEDKEQGVCAEIDKWKKCIYCYRKCCLKCLKPGIIIDGVTGVGYECNECGIPKEKKDLLNAIKQSIYGKYCTFGPVIQVNVIYIIYQYSVGITVKCCNQINNCLNEINFNTKYEMELNAQQNSQLNAESNPLQIYQYCLYKNQTSNIIPNVTIYDKKRRIFCKDCTKNALAKCVLCNVSKEVKIVKSKWIGYNYKCKNCLNLIEKEKKQKTELKTDGKNKSKIAKVDVDNKFVDIHFKNFKDNVFPEIKLRKSRTKQNMKAIVAVLQKNNLSIDDLPYNLWREECNVKPKCWRKYCAFYHDNKEKALGKIMSMMAEKRKYNVKKFEMKMLRDKSRYFTDDFNQNLMDYNFNLSRKHRKGNLSRKYNVKRKTKKRWKNRAYYLRKADKRCNVKQNKKFKEKYLLELSSYY